MKLALPLKSLCLFAAVTLGSGALAASAMSFTFDTVARAAASTPVQKRTTPRYVAQPLPVLTPEQLNVARAVPVVPVTAAPVTIAEAQPVAPVAAPTYTHRVAVSALRVRSGPQKTAPQVFTLAGGKWVNIGENVRGWVRVTDQQGRQGWVYGKLLQEAQTQVVASAD